MPSVQISRGVASSLFVLGSVLCGLSFASAQVTQDAAAPSQPEPSERVASTAPDGAAAEPAEPAAPESPPPPVEHGAGAVTRFRLPDNGLEVAVQHDPSQPLVAVVMSYDVGTRDEPEGYRELAHLVEHLTFRGSRHLGDGEMGRLLQQAAADWNGFTSLDRTTYVTVLPRRSLALALWLESERMGFALESFEKRTLKLETDIVRQEWLRGPAENWGARIEESVFHEMFPEGHAYRHAADIGSKSDYRFRLEHVQSFFQQYYRPDNARLAVVGDIDVAEARALVEQYFGGLRNPRAPKPERSVRPVRFNSTEILTMAWRRPRPYISTRWMTQCREPDCAVLLALLCAYVEDEVRAALKFAAGVASQVDMHTQRFDGFYGLELRVELAPTTDPAAAQPALDQVLRSLRRQTLAEAQLRALKQASLVAQLRALEGPEARALGLATHGERDWTRVDPDATSARLAGISADDLRRAVATHLDASGRLVVRVQHDERAKEGKVIDRVGDLQVELLEPLP